MSQTILVPPAFPAPKRLASHLRLLRLDHSVKQIFIVPGIVIAVSLTHAGLTPALLGRVLMGLLAATAIASSNYVLNELLDAPYDRLHPTKCLRPAACRSIHVPLAYVQWLLLGLGGLLIGSQLSRDMLLSLLALWIMGCFYNIPPVRTKDISYLDVLSESLNNPIRFCIGWYIVTASIIPPASMLIAYWMLGAYFMALKRFSEYRQIGSESAVRYRRSFGGYTEKSLLNSVLFYAATSMLFFGAFIMRYRMEMVFAFPLIALLMAVYFDLSFDPESPVQNPEKLFREPRLMVLLAACCTTLVVMSFVNLPWLIQIFPKSQVH